MPDKPIPIVCFALYFCSFSIFIDIFFAASSSLSPISFFIEIDLIAVNDDKKLGTAIGVSGTPSLYLNGKKTAPENL